MVQIVQNNPTQWETDKPKRMQESLQSLVSLLAQNEEEQKAKKRDEQFRQAIKAEMGIDVPEGAGEKAYLTSLENKLDPEKRMFASMFPQGGEDASVSDNAKAMDALSKNSTGNIKPDMIMRGIMSKKFGVPYEQMMTGDEKTAKAQTEIDQKVKEKASTDLNEYTTAANKALVGIDKIEKYARGLGDFKRGFLPQIKSRADIAMRAVAQDKPVAEYLGAINQELIPLARNLAEEKGPITNTDVDRIQKGLGEATAPLETKIALLNELRDKVAQALNTKMQAAGVAQDQFSNQFPELGQFLQGKGRQTEFATEAQAEAANLPKGSVVIINGRRAIIE
jgi:hypothetical protein